jgi:hypothetical protein
MIEHTEANTLNVAGEGVEYDWAANRDIDGSHTEKRLWKKFTVA